MKKYDPLMEYLEASDKTSITLPYEEIEKIIGDKLPETALERIEWWSNNDPTHTQSASWSEAGYKTTDVKLGHSVTFEKRNEY